MCIYCWVKYKDLEFGDNVLRYRINGKLGERNSPLYVISGLDIMSCIWKCTVLMGLDVQCMETCPQKHSWQSGRLPSRNTLPSRKACWLVTFM